MDFSAPATAAAAWTARYFAPDAELVLVHAITLPDIPPFLRARMPPTRTLVETAEIGAKQRMRELSASLGTKRIQPEIRVGNAAELIADVSREYDADVIVVGQPSNRSAALGRLGTTAEQLVRDVSIPVLLAAGFRNATPRRLLVPVNDSAVAPWVIDWARFLTERFQARATALHVIGSAVLSSVLAAAPVGGGGVEPEGGAVRADLSRETNQWLERLVRSRGDGGAINTDVAFGDPGQEIVDAARRLDADLVVMGSRGAKGLARLLLGSVASYVLRRVLCPTLVVKEPEDELVG
jgi:nucleotide-binding universal stress UspA family protein